MTINGRNLILKLGKIAGPWENDECMVNLPGSGQLPGNGHILLTGKC